MDSKGQEGTLLSPESFEISGLWRTREGTLPFLDDPTVSYTAHTWDKPPIFNLNLTMHRVQSQQITKSDMGLSRLLIDWKCLTEKQIRQLGRTYYDKGHLVGSRLRLLQKTGWFDGFVMQSLDGQREHIWLNGIAAFQYFSFVEGLENLDETTAMIAMKGFVVSICAINEFRLRLEERGKPAEATYSPIWRKSGPVLPLSRLVVDTNRGPLTLYVERLLQAGKPLSYLYKKIAMYEAMVEKNGGTLPAERGGAAMVVWSVGSIQAIEELVASIDHFPDHFLMTFLVDEHMDSFPNAFFLAKKGRNVGDVEIRPLNMDLF